MHVTTTIANLAFLLASVNELAYGVNIRLAADQLVGDGRDVGDG